jgi:phosphatidylinositol alpha-1,6-mannosyltransferase
VDTERFRPAAPDPAVRARLGWTGRRVVLTVGRLQQRKGHDQMIRALRQVRQAVPDVLYSIVGAGEEEDRLRRLVAEEGAGDLVQFLGEPDDAVLITCYQQCDLFALPNRQVGQDIEGFGMVLLEAQACGKPVLAGASGGTGETMRVPETGRIVPCEGPHELASAVIALLADAELRARMGAAGRRWAVERFDWAALSRQARDLFRNGGRVVPEQTAAGAAPHRSPRDVAARV